MNFSYWRDVCLLLALKRLLYCELKGNILFARRDMSIVIPFFKGKIFNLALERSTGKFNLSSQEDKRPPLVHRHKSDTKKACLIPWSQRFFLSRERRRQVVKRRERVKSLVTLDLNLTFMQHANNCQRRKIDNYKRDQWQLSNHVFPRYYQSNEPIILICVFVLSKI